MIYVLATSHSQIPDGLEDAARMEGSTRLGALWRVIVPISAPAVATVVTLSFVVAYNEFFLSFPMTDGRPENWAPILWGIRPWGGRLAAAVSIVGVVPMAAIVLLAQRRIVSGLARGAVRE